ncbi:MAG: hypothetical protein LKI58_01100 [Actinomyces sp.]|jgi:hypothetical protein|nr:hypothetical protein [Actinomyces sp.]MCI1641745.1 hypothetical protein [Actinomyces sp.]MCI1661561.1 hypothetical protein [Actinomyces sp.]MCI1690618.1 hypothetical protein [Actinomyces sp.]MCI1786654.1 hypothetical protein [Actinomyces sp.]MCI1830718.1 hypothetical protein [Actinomyces sp.]
MSEKTISEAAPQAARQMFRLVDAEKLAGSADSCGCGGHGGGVGGCGCGGHGRRHAADGPREAGAE